MPSAWPASPPCSPRPTRRSSTSERRSARRRPRWRGGHDRRRDRSRARRARLRRCRGGLRPARATARRDGDVAGCAGRHGLPGQRRGQGAARARHPAGGDPHGDDQGRAGHPRHDGGVGRVTELAATQPGRIQAATGATRFTGRAMGSPAAPHPGWPAGRVARIRRGRGRGMVDGRRRVRGSRGRDVPVPRRRAS